RTGSCSPRATASTCPRTAASSGAHSSPSSPTSRPSPSCGLTPKGSDPSSSLFLQPELAARDDHGRAADLDRLRALGRSRRARVELRRPADLVALRDLDLVAERDAAMAC